MPRRATKRGTERTPLAGEYDVLICGASFAGLAVARELAGSGARTLMVDRYEIGERPTSACGIPTSWMEAHGVSDAIQQTFGKLRLHTPHGVVEFDLPYTFSTFDYRRMCELLREQCADADFETAKVQGRRDDVVRTDRGDLRADLIVDALGWRRVLAPDSNLQPPAARLTRAIEVHPPGSRGDALESWIDPSYIPAGYGWCFPADGELRIGVASYRPDDHVKEPTQRLAGALEADIVRYQGNWIPHKMLPATDDGVFFVGDSAGHCLAATAEGIRTALYFGLACGRELRDVVQGRGTKRGALTRYHLFSARHAWKFDALLNIQQSYPRLPTRALHSILQGLARKPVTDRLFNLCLGIAPPDFAGAPRALRSRRSVAVAA